MSVHTLISKEWRLIRRIETCKWKRGEGDLDWVVYMNRILYVFKRTKALSFIELYYSNIINSKEPILTCRFSALLYMNLCLCNSITNFVFVMNWYRTQQQLFISPHLYRPTSTIFLHITDLWFLLGWRLTWELVPAVHSCCRRWVSPEPVIHLLLLYRT